MLCLNRGVLFQLVAITVRTEEMIGDKGGGLYICAASFVQPRIVITFKSFSVDCLELVSLGFSASLFLLPFLKLLDLYS